MHKSAIILRTAGSQPNKDRTFSASALCRLVRKVGRMCRECHPHAPCLSDDRRSIRPCCESSRGRWEWSPSRLELSRASHEPFVTMFRVVVHRVLSRRHRVMSHLAPCSQAVDNLFRRAVTMFSRSGTLFSRAASMFRETETVFRQTKHLVRRHGDHVLARGNHVPENRAPCSRGSKPCYGASEACSFELKPCSRRACTLFRGIEMRDCKRVKWRGLIDDEGPSRMGGRARRRPLLCGDRSQQQAAMDVRW